MQIEYANRDEKKIIHKLHNHHIVGAKTEKKTLSFYNKNPCVRTHMTFYVYNLHIRIVGEPRLPTNLSKYTLHHHQHHTHTHAACLRKRAAHSSHSVLGYDIFPKIIALPLLPISCVDRFNSKIIIRQVFTN